MAGCGDSVPLTSDMYCIVTMGLSAKKKVIFGRKFCANQPANKNIEGFIVSVIQPCNVERQILVAGTPI